MTNKKYFLLFSFTSLFWGGSFLGIHYALESFPPLTAAFLRISICVVQMVGILLYTNRQAFKHPLWRTAFFGGWLLIGLPWMFLFFGSHYLQPALASILNATVPFFVAIFTPLLIKQETLPLQKLLGLAIGFLGVTLIFYKNLILAPDNHMLYGVLLVLGMAVFYALGTLALRRTSAQIPLLTNLFYQALGASVFLGVLSLLIDHPWQIHTVSLKSIGALVYLGTFSTTLAWLMFFAIVRDKGAIYGSVTTYMAPIVSVLLDHWILRSDLQSHQFAGMSLVLAGLLVLQWGEILLRKWKRIPI